MVDQRFAELRILLSNPINQETWDILCRFFQDWPEGDEKKLAVAYACQHLDTDEQVLDALRIVPVWYWLDVPPVGATHSYWPIFRSLSFMKNALDDQSFCSLVSTGHLGHITELQLHDQRLTSQALHALASSPDVGQLKKINATNNQIESEGIEALSSSPHLKQLSSLSLARNPLGPDALQHLSKTSILTELAFLSLSYCETGEDALEELFLSVDWEHLSHLELRGAGLIGKGTSALSRSSFWSSLSTLQLDQNALGLHSQSAFFETPANGLRHLSLQHCQLEDHHIERLVRSPWVADLETLDLSFNLLSDRGFEMLASCKALLGLSHLKIGYNQNTSNGINLLRRKSSALKDTKLVLY